MERNERKQRQGVITSDKRDKTITVTIEVRKKHPIYGKFVKQTKKLTAHDEKNEGKTGDIVMVAETRPLSKTKRWRLVQIVERAK